MSDVPDLPPVDVLVKSWLGPRLITAFIVTAETGIILNQSLRFWLDVSTERTAIKVLVVWVTFAAVFHSCALIWDAWDMFIIDFNDFRSAFSPSWISRTGNLVVTMMAVPVQVFYTWRCWRLTNYRTVLIFLSILCAAYFAMMVRVTIYVVEFNFEWAFEASEGQTDVEPWRPDPFVVASLVFPAALDVLITCILFFFILKARSDGMTRRFQKVIRRLMGLIWEAAIPPCVCAIVALITYLTVVDSFWSLLFQTVLGELYVISLFVSLNGFRGINRAKIGISPTTVLDKDIPTSYTEDVEMQATTQHEESIREYEQPSISRNSLSSAMQHKDVTLTIDLVAGTDSSFLQEKSSLRRKFEGSSPAESGTSIKA